MHVVVCGAGVIGSAIALELAREGIDVTLVERWRVGGCASGKSGGFIARDWCEGTPVAPLARRSFDLHEAWADELGNPYGYRKVDTFSAALSVRRKLGNDNDTELVPWLAPDAAHQQRLGSPATTAQLDPERFTQTLAAAATDNGATIRFDAIAGLTLSTDGSEVAGVCCDDGSEIGCDSVMLALGPWSLLAARWLPLPPVHGLKGHSIIFKPANAFPPEAIFAEFEDRDGDVLTPEIVPRADGTLYVCGLSGNAALPVDPARVGPEPGGCERLREAAIRLVPRLADAEVIAEQACYRPITADGIPLIGKIDGPDNAYIATGHSVWGMLNAPATGEAVAELITTGQTSTIDLSAFAPDRLSPLDPGELELR